MNYNFEISIPAETEEKEPETTIMKMTYGVITHVAITVPPGHRSLAHLRVFYHEAQLYPLNRGGNYHGDYLSIDFDEYQPLVVEPYDLKAKGWNEDTKNAHAFIMNFTVLRPEEMQMEIPRKSLDFLAALVGKEVEI